MVGDDYSFGSGDMGGDRGPGTGGEMNIGEDQNCGLGSREEL